MSSNTPHPSVCLSVLLSVPYGFLIQKQKSLEKPELVRTFPRAGLAGCALQCSGRMRIARRTAAYYVGIGPTSLRSGSACDCYRFWYENPGVFTASQLVELRQASLARVICDNSDAIRQLPRDVFLFLPSLPDGQVSCDDVPAVDLKVWAQCCQGIGPTACLLLILPLRTATLRCCND